MDPIRLILAQPGHYVDSINDPMRVMHTQQTDSIIKVLETLTQMNEALKQVLTDQP